MSHLAYDVFLNQQLEKQRRQAALQKAAVAQLLLDAGIDQRGWFSRQSARLVSRFGRLLVVWGERLECYDSPSRGQSLRHQAI
jgi:hypothetical protein